MLVFRWTLTFDSRYS